MQCYIVSVSATVEHLVQCYIVLMCRCCSGAPNAVLYSSDVSVLQCSAPTGWGATTGVLVGVCSSWLCPHCGPPSPLCLLMPVPGMVAHCCHPHCLHKHCTTFTLFLLPVPSCLSLPLSLSTSLSLSFSLFISLFLYFSLSPPPSLSSSLPPSSNSQLQSCTLHMLSSCL